MSQKKQIALYLITGFLGSGKTTLLQNLLNSFAESKVGVIINEFGELGVDGKVVNRDGVELVEIENGSIFCCCRKTPFINGLFTLAQTDIDILLVETSGLSDPSNMKEILDQTEEVAGAVFNYQGSICVVSTDSFLKVVTTNQTVEKQVLYSDLILLNKIDLAEEREVAEVEKKVDKFNPDAQLVKTRYCEIDSTKLKNLIKVESSAENKESINRPDNKPQTYICKINGPIAREELLNFLESVSEYLFRFKGFIQLLDGWYYINGVQDDIEFNPIESKRDNSELVLIAASKKNGEIEKKIKTKGKKCISKKLMIN